MRININQLIPKLKQLSPKESKLTTMIKEGFFSLAMLRAWHYLEFIFNSYPTIFNLNNNKELIF